MIEPRPELEVAIACARNAGDVIMRFYGSADLRIDEKPNHTPVTEADYAAEKIILDGLRAQFPYPILSEETVQDPARFSSEYVWVIDPLDGTKSFTKGEPTFAVLIGLLRNSVPFLGAAYMPATDTMYFAEAGKGTYRSINGNAPERMYVSSLSEIQESVALASSHTDGNEALSTFGFKAIRRFQGFAPKALSIAEGSAEIYINGDPKGSEWDSCAPEIIVREAGGKVTDMYGAPLLYNAENPTHTRGTLVSNGTALHEAVVWELAPRLARGDAD